MKGERIAVCDIDRGDYFAHHSRLATAEYLDRFGHWDYWVDNNPRVSEPRPGPWLYDGNGGRELLAADIKREGTCRLTAFLQPAPPMFRLRAAELQREADAFQGSPPSRLSRLLGRVSGGRPAISFADPAIERYRQVAGELRCAAGSWGNPAVVRFMEAEAAAQRDVLLDALQRVRAIWSGG